MVCASPPTVSHTRHAHYHECITEVYVCAGQHVSTRLQYSTGSGLVRWLVVIRNFSELNLGIQNRAFTHIVVW